MKTMNVAEMQAINAGKTYTYKCRYCGKKFTTRDYSWWALIAKLMAKLTAQANCRNHETQCFAKRNGLW